MNWQNRVQRFLASAEDSRGGYPSVSGGNLTAYGTAYAILTRAYLGVEFRVGPSLNFLKSVQCRETGYFQGPELEGWKPEEGAAHDLQHVMQHLACTVVPALTHFGELPDHKLKFAHWYLKPKNLALWLSERDWTEAWLEGNNLLFVGQLLVYLRDVERLPQADQALELWFDWLFDEVDRTTGLWGTNGYCSAFVAMCGGYHQLLVYYHEGREVASHGNLVDVVLKLQHVDGGFSPAGRGGACEDVDAVDILVNAYKVRDYRRAAIRNAVRRCARTILETQNEDGGFSYKPDARQSHMGIPGTEAGPNQSTMFATWFRTHTLALAAQILPDEPHLSASLGFSTHLSMGWHPRPRKPRPLTIRDQIADLLCGVRTAAWFGYGRCRQIASRVRSRL